MTSGRRQGFEPPVSPHFFKIILSDDTLPDGKLDIPKRFLQRHGSDLQGSVFLKVPSGTTVWPVELEWSDGMARLGQGWQKFRDYYSIGFGQFLVFRYEPSLFFHVVIFDSSTSEIEYPTDPLIMTKLEPERELSLLKKEETDGISAKTSQGCWPSPNVRKKLMSPSACVSQKGKSGTFSKDGMIGKSTSRATPPRTIARRSNVPCPAAHKMAQEFKSKHPMFILVMYPSYVKKSNGNVPAKFMLAHVRRRVQIVTLTHKKNSWPVKFIKFPGYHCPGKLSQGWSAFKRGTSLCEGDVCVFELTKRSGIVLKVTIFRSSDYT